MATSNDMAKPRTKEEQAQEIAQKIQAKFLLLIETEGQEEFDPRDINQVRNTLDYVYKFAWQYTSDESKAYKLLVNAMKWRKSFGANDLDRTCIEPRIIEMGLSFPHGVDRQGNVIVILNIRLHKKDAFKPIQLNQFVVYCLETHLKFFPDKRVTVMFDMSESGISNLDLDFIRFFISCFRHYYPSLLATLLVYDLPWILQAAWKIIKSWLDEQAVKKIKFVNKDTIRDYIDPDELMERYGGNDPWVYNPSSLADNMRSLANRLCLKPGETSLSPEITGLLNQLENNVKGTEVTEAATRAMVDKAVAVEEVVSNSEEREKVMEAEVTMETTNSLTDSSDGVSKKQVRFSGDTKPISSHRSRYNNDPNTQIRRRHVEKLLGMQSPPKKTATSPTKVADDADSDCASESDVEMNIVGVKQSPLFHSNHSSHDGIPSLEINPPKLIQFTKNKNGVPSCVLQLINHHDVHMAFKVKTTAPSKYKVKPSLGYVSAHGQSDIMLRVVSGTESDLRSVAEDKFLVQSYVVESVPPIHVKQSFLALQWKGYSKDKMSEHLLKCSIEEGNTNSSTTSPIIINSQPSPPAMTTTTTVPKPTIKPDITTSLQTQVNEISRSCDRLQQRVSILLLMQLLTLTLLVVVLVYLFMS